MIPARVTYSAALQRCKLDALLLAVGLLTELAAALKKPMVGIHFDGRPISSDAADKYLNSIIEAWSPAERGAFAIASVLAGDYNPCGKMPVSVAYNSGQIPAFYNHRFGSANHQSYSIGFADHVDCPHTLRHCFGHGLSYSEYEYSELEIVKKELSGTESLELTGFCRICIKLGETKKIKYTLPLSELAFLDRNRQWKTEKGIMVLKVGSSSADIRLTDTFTITDNTWIDGKERAFYGKDLGVAL